ncbi:MAG: assimilatory sulfite reductase (NADPH) hemoprotein subunit [Prolixibacteraceae bacterium]|nr:assimilatory sulfite reductase (NADPH) hemoprotein subunit [Prolixibacteraceae bacterium]
MSNIDWSTLSEVEKIKYDSNYLRGSIAEGLKDEVTGAIALNDRQLSKFHGIYQQHDRDLERERKQQLLEPAYSFLIRVRMPGGLLTPAQWLRMDELSEQYANGTLKLTTRQAFQLHGVLKRNLKTTIQEINHSLLDTIAACGDVNRNVMCHPNPSESVLHQQLYETARAISEHLAPKTSAYHEIWLDKKLIAGGEKDFEPIYGRTYLPRKFKIGLVLPPYNDCDVFSQDLGFIAIVDDGKIAGYNVVLGGGLGSTFGIRETYPRLGTVIGYCAPDQVIEVAEKVVVVQRNEGNRKDRKLARLKYTIDRLGIEGFVALLHEQLSFQLQAARSFQFLRNGDRYGWRKGPDGLWNLTLFVEGGRVKDRDNFRLKSALREIATFHDGHFILTGNQNLILANASPATKSKINHLLLIHGVKPQEISGLRSNSIACVALNTCGLAFAEAERYLPALIDKLEVLLNEYGLFKDEMVIRMTGCPNGCGRPSLAEIGFIGKSPGHYNLYLGGNFTGSRLNALYRENITETEILDALKPIFADYAANRGKGEHFGDFVVRKNYVKTPDEGREFVH